MMKMPKIIAIGEALVEIMRPDRDIPLGQPGTFIGPFPSGAPAIFADAAARLGVPTGFIGVTGDDDFADCLSQRLQRDGVDLSHLRRQPDQTTGCAFVAYFTDGSRRFIFHLRHAAAGLLGPDDIASDYFAGICFLHIMGSALALSESARFACYKAVRLAKERGARISLDPNLRPELLGLDMVRAVCEPVLAAADVVLPSGAEARMLTGAADDVAAAKGLAAKGRIVALKQGAAGSTVYSAEGEIHVPAFPVQEIDPTGAGDCYDAAFLTGLLQGWPLAQVARFANAVGALAVSKLGPMEGAPTYAEAMRLAGL